MAYVLFILIGLLFDLIVLAISGGILFILLRPEVLNNGFNILQNTLSTNQGKLQLLIIAVAGIILSLRGLFVLLFGRGSPEIAVSAGDSGSVAIAHSSVEHILRRLVQASGRDASLKGSAVKPAGMGAVNIRVRIELDLVETNLPEYTKELEAVIRAHFKDGLGLDVKSLRTRVECTPARRQGAAGGQ